MRKAAHNYQVSTLSVDMRPLIKKLYANHGYTITRPVPVV